MFVCKDPSSIILLYFYDFICSQTSGEKKTWFLFTTQETKQNIHKYCPVIDIINNLKTPVAKYNIPTTKLE
jgi:hypothetical protein